MRRILVSLLFALVLLCSVVGLRNIVAQQGVGSAPVMVAAGSMPPPPPPPLKN